MSDRPDRRDTTVYASRRPRRRHTRTPASAPAPGRTFVGTLRLAILLAVLAFVALGAWLDWTRTRAWDATLRVTVYPLATTSDVPDVRRYVAGLHDDDFTPAARFLAEEAEPYGVSLGEPVRFRVSHAATRPPPALPRGAGTLRVMLWSLQLRWYAARVAWNDPLPSPDIQVFATFAPVSGSARALPDSVGLRKGLVAVAHLYASPEAAGSHLVVLTHELLHTLGATDKYDRRTGQPLEPDGLGDPDRKPRYPQDYGEIMAGRIATSATDAAMPDSLDDMTVGDATAREIGWLD